jgi:hypothetical protein
VSVIEPPELTDEEQLGNGPSRTQPPPAAARTRSVASDGAGRVADAGGAGGAGGAASSVAGAAAAAGGGRAGDDGGGDDEAAKKAREVLGWKPLFELDDALVETVRWYTEFLGSASNVRHLRSA